MNDKKISEDAKVEINEDNLSASLSGGALHLLTDALVDCFNGSGAINHLECSFEDPEDGEQYTMLMQKKSGLTQGEKNDRLTEENKQLREHLSNLIDESIYLAQFKNDTLRGNIRSTDLDEPEWHDYQTIGEAGAYLESLNK